MKNKTIILVTTTLLACIALFGQAQTTGKKYVMVIHGGAGNILKKNMTAVKEAAYTQALTLALQKGYEQIMSGKTSVDAIQAAIIILEDSPLFNAGKGAVFTHEGRNELDAAIMYGSTLAAGAVAGVTIVKNPISAARLVMEKSGHVMLAGSGADKFAAAAGLEIVDPSYFWTKESWASFQGVLKADSVKQAQGNMKSMNRGAVNNDSKFGTVGAVALDKAGNLAAGTSTGGMTNKKFGRIGDAPIIGAGTYANNKTAAISCTGWGEFYIRSVAAYDVSALMEYSRMKVAAASKTVLGKIQKLGGTGGLIALDKNGNVATPFNTSGMYRGMISEDGKVEVYMYK